MVKRFWYIFNDWLKWNARAFKDERKKEDNEAWRICVSRISGIVIKCHPNKRHCCENYHPEPGIIACCMGSKALPIKIIAKFAIEFHG